MGIGTFYRWTGRRGRRGQGLVDVMASTTVVAGAVLSLIPAHHASEVTAKRSQSIETATQSARQHLDALRQQGYTALPSIPAGSTSTNRTFTPVGVLTNASGQVVVTRVDASLSPTTTDAGRRRIAVTVAWNGSARDRGSVTLTTLMAE